MREIPDKDYITILEQNKIFFFGGLIAQTKLRNNLLSHVTAIPNEEESKRISSRNDFLLNKSSIYFDIEKLDFEKQKFPENSLIIFTIICSSQDYLMVKCINLILQKLREKIQKIWLNVMFL